jgi:HEAT repeat protein
MRKLLGLSLLLLLPSPVRSAPSPRDLDVQVSSGSPLDWLNDLPRPIPTVDRTRLGAEGGRQTMVEEPPHVQATDVFSFARITTVDLIGEIPWTVREPSETNGIYPPPVKDDILWLALGTLLRRLLHPAQVNDTEAFEYLTYLGEPAFTAFDMSRSEKTLETLRLEFRKYVTPIPKERPDYEKGKDEHETMMLRLTYDDLVRAHPFSFDQKFAARIALLGEEAAPFVIQASKSSHSFLARNAVVMLGRYDDGDSLKRLRELVQTSLDACVRARAVDGLVRRRDTGASEIFLEMLRKTRERPFGLSLIRGLGILGAKSAGPAIIEYGILNNDFDTCCTVLTAMARLSPEKDKESALRLCANCKQRHFNDPVSNLSPVTPDEPDTREAIVKQLALLVEASYKVADAEHEMLALVDAARRDLKNADPNDRRIARGLLSKFNAPVVYALLQVLGRLEKGRELLLAVAADTREDVTMRVHALIELARANAPGLKDKLKPFCALTQDQPVAETALRILGAIDGPSGVEAAKEIVALYQRNLSLSKKSVVLVAIRFLGTRKALPLDRLVEIAELELMAREEAKKAAAKTEKPTDGIGSTQRDFSSPVPFLEHIAIEIGRSCDATAVPILVDLLATKDAPGRGEAAVGLGSTRSPDAWPALLAALDDADPWVRLMAYRSLRYSLGKDSPCDWLYGTIDARQKAMAQFKSWIDEKKK